MQLIYAPEGQETQRWDVDLNRLRVQECEAIEKRTGMPYGTQYKQSLLAGSTSARRALLWTLLRREHHTMPYGDVDFADGELVLQFDVDEYRAMRDGAEDDPSLSEDERARVVAVLTRAIDELTGDDVDQVDEVLPDQADDLGKEAPSASLPIAIG